jgi:hypothetical protein
MSLLNSEQIHDAGIAYARKCVEEGPREDADAEARLKIMLAIAWESGYRRAVQLEVIRDA